MEQLARNGSKYEKKKKRKKSLNPITSIILNICNALRMNFPKLVWIWKILAQEKALISPSSWSV